MLQQVANLMSFDWYREVFMIRSARYYLRYKPYGGKRYIHSQAKLCSKTNLNGPCMISKGVRIKRAEIGGYTYVSRDARLLDCSVGRYCSIGPECLIGGLGAHPTDWYSTSPLTYSPGNTVSQVLGSTRVDLGFCETGTVILGNDVWLGARVLVADGVRIGDGAVVGANTVVTKDVPPYAVYYGSPAKVQRYRFTEEVIQEILATGWWRRSPDQIDTEHLRKIINDS